MWALHTRAPAPHLLHVPLLPQEVDANSKANQSQGIAALNVNDLLDDAELQKLHEERIAKLKSEQEKRAAMQRQGHGEVQEITEGEFLEVTTKTDLVVCHFFHRDFERCKIMDKHLAVLARRHFTTRFIKLSAPVSPARRAHVPPEAVHTGAHAAAGPRLAAPSGAQHQHQHLPGIERTFPRTLRALVCRTRRSSPSSSTSRRSRA